MNTTVKIPTDELTAVAVGYFGSMCAIILSPIVYHFLMNGFLVPVIGGFVSWFTIRLIKHYYPDDKPLPFLRKKNGKTLQTRQTEDVNDQSQNCGD